MNNGIQLWCHEHAMYIYLLQNTIVISVLTGHLKFKMHRSTRLQGNQNQGVGVDRVF